MIHIIWILSVLYRIPNYILFFEHFYQYNIYVNIYISLNHNTVPSHCKSLTYSRYSGLYFDRYNATLSHNRLCYLQTLHRCYKRIQRWVSSHSLFKKRGFCLSCQVPLFPLAVHCFIFIIFCFPTTESYTVSLFTHISFSQLTNTKVSGYFDLTNTTTLFVHHIEYRLFNQVLHFIAIWP